MLKLNEKGFMMVETLIAAVFAMTIFTLIYVNFYPLIGEYEKREVYDDIDGKYAAYWIKRIIQSSSTTSNFIAYVNKETCEDNEENCKYYKFTCENDIIKDDTYTKRLCNNLKQAMEIENIYLIKFKTGEFKNIVANNDNFSSGLQDYMVYLPTYEKLDSLNDAQYRVIIEFHHKKDDNDYYSYSTMEVKK